MACEATYLGNCCGGCTNGRTALPIGTGGATEFALTIDDEFKLSPARYGCSGGLGYTPSGRSPVMAVGWWAYTLSIAGTVRLTGGNVIFYASVLDDRTVVALPHPFGNECYSATGFNGYLANAFTAPVTPADFSVSGSFYIDPCQNPAMIWLQLTRSQFGIPNLPPCIVSLACRWIVSPP
jgi:hypothetical protein